MADQGIFTRRGAVTPKTSRLGGQPGPAPGRMTSGLRRAGLGFFEATDHPFTLRPSVKGRALASDHNATVLYVITGRYSGGTETWLSKHAPTDPPPSGHAVTDRTFTVTTV